MENVVGSKKQKLNVSTLVKVSLLGVISYLIMYFEIPLIPFPAFLKLDFSDLPAIIGGFAIGPMAGILIVLIKNILHFILNTQTGGVGELANFIIGGSFVLTSSMIYEIKRSKKMAVVSCFAASIVMAISGGLANYFVLIPLYSKFMPLEAIIQMGKIFLPIISDVKSLVIYAIIPFNIIKGIILSILTGILYKKISILLKK